MKALSVMWNHTLMVVLTSLSAALYAAILFPFKLFPIIPGVTEIRPGNAIPIVCSLLFGPAGAFGAALGNTIGDIVGFGPGVIFGFVGNFLYGFVPYVFWRAFFGERMPQANRWNDWVVLVFICVVASAACAFPICLGVDVVLEGVPFAVLSVIIFFNNLIMALLLSPLIFFALLPRVKRWGLLYTQILPADAVRAPRFAMAGVVLLTVGALGGLGGGLAIATGVHDQPVGVPHLVRALADLQNPDSAGEAPAAGESVKAAPEQEGDSAEKKPEKPADWRARNRKALAVGSLPALALIAAGMLLL